MIGVLGVFVFVIENVKWFDVGVVMVWGVVIVVVMIFFMFLLLCWLLFWCWYGWMDVLLEC